MEETKNKKIKNIKWKYSRNSAHQNLYRPVQKFNFLHPRIFLQSFHYRWQDDWKLIIILISCMYYFNNAGDVEYFNKPIRRIF